MDSFEVKTTNKCCSYCSIMCEMKYFNEFDTQSFWAMELTSLGINSLDQGIMQMCAAGDRPHTQKQRSIPPAANTSI